MGKPKGGIFESKTSISRKILTISFKFHMQTIFTYLRLLVVYYRKIYGSNNLVVYGIQFIENSFKCFLQTRNSPYKFLYFIAFRCVSSILDN